MRRTAFALILLVTAPKAIAGDESMAGYAFGKSYTITIRGADLRKTPPWDQAADNPPLSARKALKLVTDSRKATVPGPADWEWHLQYLGLREADGNWYWLAHFEALPRQAAFDGVAPDLYVAVLMDGTVVKPVARDYQR